MWKVMSYVDTLQKQRAPCVTVVIELGISHILNITFASRVSRVTGLMSKCSWQLLVIFFFPCNIATSYVSISAAQLIKYSAN